MDDITRGNSRWEFQSPIANLSTGGLSGRVDVSRPNLGLHAVAIHGRPLEGQFLSIASSGTKSGVDAQPAWSVADAYVRGSDLVATYRPTDDWPFSPQVYWQASSSLAAGTWLGSLSLYISVQTHLLDTWPRISVVSKLVVDEVLHVSPDSAGQFRAKLLEHGTHTLG